MLSRQRRRADPAASAGVVGEHDAQGEATLQVLHGRVRLVSVEVSWDSSAGDLLVIPRARHSLRALEDAVVLLTVTKIG